MLRRRLTSTNLEHYRKWWWKPPQNRARRDCRRYASTFSYAGVGNIAAIAAESREKLEPSLPRQYLDHHEKTGRHQNEKSPLGTLGHDDGSHFLCRQYCAGEKAWLITVIATMSALPNLNLAGKEDESWPLTAKMRAFIPIRNRPGIFR